MTKLIRTAIVAAGLAPAAVLGQPFQQEGWMRLPTTYDQQREAAFEGQSGPVTGRPLSADEVRSTTQTLTDGSHINKSETDHFYRDAMGRMRTETPTGAIIYDPVAGYTYDLTNGSKSYTKSAIRAGSITTIAAEAHHSSVSSRSESGTGWQRVSKPAPGGPVTEELPAQTMNGVWVKGSRVTITIPAGAVGNDRDLKSVNERWYSDDLKVLVKSSNVDPRFGTTTYELRNIVQAPPDPSLFQVPADYKEGH